MLRKLAMLTTVVVTYYAQMHFSTTKIVADEIKLQLNKETSLSITEEQAYHAKDLQCLTAMLYGEARGEDFVGKVGVAYTAKTRSVKRTKSICQIVLRKWQYTALTQDKKLRNIAMTVGSKPKFNNPIDAKSWDDCELVAHMVLSGTVDDPTGGADHYYEPTKVAKPAWAKVMKKTLHHGGHKFYASN